MIAAYVRVSSASQTAAMQRDAIGRAATARGDVIGRWLSEKMSAKTTKRPVLEQLRELARAGGCERVYVYRLDRLTRSGIRDTLDLVEELRAHGCHLVSIADGFDLEGPASEVVLAVIAWAAKMERLAIGERISAARARVEAKGGRWGRPRRMSPCELARAKLYRSKAHTVRFIAQALKIPRATVQRALAQKPPSRPLRKTSPK